MRVCVDWARLQAWYLQGIWRNAQRLARRERDVAAAFMYGAAVAWHTRGSSVGSWWLDNAALVR